MFDFLKEQHNQAKERVIKILEAAADTAVPLIFIQSLHKEQRVHSIYENVLDKVQKIFTTLTDFLFLL